MLKSDVQRNIEAPSLITPFDSVRAVLVLKNKLVCQDETNTQRVHREQEFFGSEYVLEDRKRFDQYLYSSYEENILGNFETLADEEGADEEESKKRK